MHQDQVVLVHHPRIARRRFGAVDDHGQPPAPATLPQVADLGQIVASRAQRDDNPGKIG